MGPSALGEGRGGGAGDASGGLAGALAAPLQAAAAEYAEAAATLAQMAGELAAIARGEPADQPKPTEPVVAGEPLPPTIQLEVHATDVGAVLDFEEQLATLPRVTRISMRGFSSGMATFAVDIGPATADARCARCGRPAPSLPGVKLTLCDNCARSFRAQRRVSRGAAAGGGRAQGEA